MPEDRQIGRAASIEMLSARIGDGDATHQWLIGPRRIGKTSVAKAVLARLRTGGAVALDVDMSKLAITNEEGLAGELARQAQAAHAGVSSAGGRIKRLVRLLGGVDGCEREVARLARDADVPLVFIFAGSEESAVRALRETGRPLASIGAELTLPDISSEDWMSGLEQRFAEGEIAIGGSELYAIIDAADGHPRRTMLICARVQSSALAAPNHEATPTVVELAIRDARGGRSWT